MKEYWVTTYTVVKTNSDPDIPKGAHFEVDHNIKAETEEDAIRIAVEERGGLGAIFKKIYKVK